MYREFFEMTDTKRGTMYKTYPMTEFKGVGEEGTGQFEAIVAVFNNVDRNGDMILSGAFTDTLEAWDAKGDPIPVIYSHQWDNLDAHIGEVLEAKEVEAGLYIKAQLNMDEPFASRVYKKMLRRTLKEFSFAYDVAPGGGTQKDDVYELSALDLIEVGPTLAGMNPDTVLIGVKDRLAALKADEEPDMDQAKGIQEIHDLTVELGAKCVEPTEDIGDPDEGDDGAEASDGKVDGGPPSGLAAKCRIELMNIK